MPLRREIKEVKKQQSCDRCGGIGKLGVLSMFSSANDMMICQECMGKGWITTSTKTYVTNKH